MKQLHFLRIPAVAFALSLPAVMHAQDFLNGSFEKNGNLCLINAAVPVFNANMKNTHAFGSFRKPDIASSNCGHGAAKDGNWFVGLATNVQGDIRSEAVTLELNSSIIKGNQYALTFWTRSRAFSPNLEIGISSNDSTAGSVFYTVASTSINAEWSEISIRFTAPENGKYISIRAVNSNTNSGVWLDAFHLRPVFVPENVVMVADPQRKNAESVKTQDTPEKNNNVAQAEIYPNPSSGVFRLNTDSASLLSLIVYNTLGSTVQEHKATDEEPIPNSIDLSDQQPGLYFVEMATLQGKVTKRIIVSR